MTCARLHHPTSFWEIPGICLPRVYLSQWDPGSRCGLAILVQPSVSVHPQRLAPTIWRQIITNRHDYHPCCYLLFGRRPWSSRNQQWLHCCPDSWVVACCVSLSEGPRKLSGEKKRRFKGWKVAAWVARTQNFIVGAYYRLCSREFHDM